MLGGEARSKRNLNRPNARTCLSPSPNAQIIDNLAVIALHSRRAVPLTKRSRPLRISSCSLVASVTPALEHYVCPLGAKNATTTAEYPSRIDLRLMLA